MDNKCPHHWLIEEAQGQQSQGTCKLCEATRMFWNSWPGAEDKGYVPDSLLTGKKKYKNKTRHGVPIGER